jgi:hypothetical protein
MRETVRPGVQTPFLMASADTPLTKVVKAMKAVARAEWVLERRRDDLGVAVRDAHAAGESVALISQVMGVTRQRVHQIIREARASEQRPRRLST